MNHRGTENAEDEGVGIAAGVHLLCASVSLWFVSVSEDLDLKGPSHKKYRVGRIWECPACGRREQTSGQIVNLRCNCQTSADPERPVWMRLVEEFPKARKFEIQSTIRPLADETNPKHEIQNPAGSIPPTTDAIKPSHEIGPLK
jgi:hypothetical protein